MYNLIQLTSLPKLHTDRLLLRPFQASDVHDSLLYRDDREFARYLPHIPQPFTIEDAQAFVDLNMSELPRTSPIFAVVLDGKLIGTVNFEIEAAARTAMIGYAIGRAWWGRGVATEAARAAQSWATGEFNLTRIWASTDSRNVRSRRVLEKLGMKQDAIRTTDQFGRDGKVVNEVVYRLNLAEL